MDDINFDELDKAVNSALQQSAPKETPSTDPVATEPAEQAAPSTPAEEPSKPVTPPVVVPKRRGQFMDMVHPSSDMIKQSAPRPNRQAATIEPLNPSIVEGAEEPVAPAEPAEAQEEAPTSDDKSLEGSSTVMQPEWPDPLDVMEQTEQEKTEEAHDEADKQPDEAAGIEQINEFPDTDEDEPSEPLVSPFLTGASPEKRPLGAFAADTPEAHDDSGDATIEHMDASEEEDQAPEAELDDSNLGEPLPTVPVPQELAPEVVSVESDEPAQSLETAEEPSSSEGPAAVMTTSIPQQYKNGEVPPEDQADHPVFDTRDYHQPLTPPAKKGHTGIIVTIVILLLAALGAGAWYAVAVLKLI